MEKSQLRKVYVRVRIYPILVNLATLVCMFIPKLTNYIFDIIGASLFTLDICYHLSFPVKLCGWYRILCISSAIYLILEWFDINILKINHYICIVQVVIITGIMIALWKKIRLRV